MALYQGHVFIPRRLRGEDLAKLQDYQSQIDAYKDSYDTYKQQVEDYNKAIEQWNAGPRTNPFEGVAPTAPAEPGFKQEDIDAFQDEALGRATQRQSQLQTAVNVAQNPEAYGFGGFGFREGGMVPAYPSYGGGGNSGGIMSVLQPFGDYLNEQIDVQRVDPFLETVSNAAYQEFGIKPDQGGGGFFSGGFYKDGGGGMPPPDQGFDFSNPFPNMPPPLPAVQNPGADNTNASSVASLSNFGPDVGNGGLFGGGPMSGGTPTQLPGPRIPTFTGTGNDGFGSVSQGPLDFLDGGMPVGDVAPSSDGLSPSIPQGISSSPVPQDVAFAYAKAQEDARKQRQGGFMGRVMLPGEMSFEDFSQGYNYRLNNPQPPLAVISQPGFGDGTMANLAPISSFQQGLQLARTNFG